jgi:hypothetical protein
MNTPESINAAKDQLNRTLSFFPRVDAKASVIFAVDTSLLAFLATRAFPYGQLGWEWFSIILTLALMAISYWHLYKAAFPSLDGGQESFLYFQEISKRTEANYIDAWKKMSDSEYLNDLMGQIWRNSVILKEKYDHVKWSFYSLALSIAPWISSIVILSIKANPPK